MGECVETLNRWGENFLGFAWPMLWQSSLLIACVFAFDWVFARRIRASVRYALWMVVLVKLILPPSLALPTGATWWLWRPHPVVTAPVIQNYTVSYGDSVPEMTPLPAVPVVVPPPKLTGDAWVLLTAAAVAVGLLSWLGFRWLRVARKVRCAAIAPVEWDAILEEARQLAALRRCPRLKLVDEAQSPAVYGLFRPVILLPRTLAGRLSGRQLRAVLLHEAVHLRRGDVWMNCAQTLLQIVYWWHPLLWVANGRIRRAREEAVDDAVMLALRDGADAYAPTLLEVAKFAFRRPLTSLGLVGILESRSALRQRVERLINLRPPRRAGVTFLSLWGIFAFCAVALPMGQGPAASDSSSTDFGSDAATLQGVQNEMRTFRVGTNAFVANLRKITGSQISPSDTTNICASLKQLFEKAGVDLSPPKTVFLNQRLGGVLFVYATPQDLDVVERIVSTLHDPRGGESGWLKSVNGQPAVDNAGAEDSGADNLVPAPANETGISGQAKAALNQALAKEHRAAHLDPLPRANGHLWQTSCQPAQTSNPAETYRSIHLDHFGPFQHVALSGVIDELSMKVSNVPILTTSKLLNGSETFVDLPKLTNVALPDVLDAIVNGANQAIRYSLLDRSIVFSPFPLPDDLNDELFDPISGTKVFTAPDNRGDLVHQTFSVETAKFSENVCEETGETNCITGFMRLAANAGVDLSPPKAVFLTRRIGALSVYATRQDLRIIEGIIAGLHCSPPLVHIKASFIEVPRQFLSGATANSLPAGMTNGGVLSAAELTKVLRLLESQEGFEDVAEPEVTTISGRETVMRATIRQPIITDYVFEDASGAAVAGSAPPYKKFSDGSRIVPKVEQVETGPVIEIVPDMFSGDDHAMYLWTSASLVDFLGYASTKGLAPNLATNAAGAEVKLPRSLPIFQMREATTDKILQDGQTLVLFPESRANKGHVWIKGPKDEWQKWPDTSTNRKNEKVLIVLATATLIDAAGDPVASSGTPGPE